MANEAVDVNNRQMHSTTLSVESKITTDRRPVLSVSCHSSLCSIFTWLTKTEQIRGDAFIGIEGKIHEAIRKSYLPTNSDFYYQNVERTMKIDIVDAERQIVDVEIFMEATVVPNKRLSAIDRSYQIAVPRAEREQASPVLRSNLLDRETRRVLVAAEGRAVDDDSTIICTLPNIPTGKPLLIQDRLKFRQCLLHDNVLMWRAVSYVDGIKIAILNRNADRLLVQHGAIGRVDFRCENGVDGMLVLSTSDLIFAGQGIIFTLQIVPKESSYE